MNRWMVIIGLLAWTNKVSNGFKIHRNEKELCPYSITIYQSKDEFQHLEEHISGGADLSFLPRLEEVTQYFQFFSRNIISNHHGHNMIFLSPKNQNQLFMFLTEIRDFLNSEKTWPPFIFITLPLDLNEISLKATLESNQSKDYNASLKFPINSDIYFLENSSGSSDSWKIMEVYSIKNNTFLDYPQNYIQATGKHGPTEFYNLLQKSYRRSNFRGVTIGAVTMDIKGYELATDFEDGESKEPRFLGGFEVQQYWYLRDALNFSEAAIKGTGYVREGPNKTLTGMAVSINKGDCDLCISSTEFIEYRVSGPDGISYLQPTFNAEMLAFFMQPPASSIRDIFTSAFSLNLWIMLFILWIFIGLSMHIAFKIYSTINPQEIHLKDVLMSTEIYIWTVGATCQRGWPLTPTVIGARIIFFFGWLFGLLCYTAFSAELVSILSIEVVPVKIFDDLLKGNFFIYNDGHIPTTKSYVKGLEEKGKIQMLDESQRNVEIDITIPKLIKTRSAMISLTDSFYPIVLKEGYSDGFICNTLSEIKVGSRPVKMGMFLKRGSPLRDIFNTKILVMSERGIKSRLVRAYLIDTSVQCLRHSSGLRPPISSKDLFTAYGILSGGFLIAVSLVFVEKLFKRIFHRELNRDQVQT